MRDSALTNLFLISHLAISTPAQIVNALRHRSLLPITSHPLWALVASFGAYFCMYGFRKPYAAATYESVHYLGLNFKFLLVMSQTFGYLIAKWLGIKIVSEIKPYQRIGLLLLLIGFAEIMLLLFGIVPPPWNILCFFFNGLPLGIIFGLILSFLEGRKNSEALIAGLCASFIVSDGFSKSMGSVLLIDGVSEKWMPFFAGLIFVIPILLFIIMLSKVPPPSDEDRVQRCTRSPMYAKERWDFYMKFAPGLTGITMVYLFVTFLRSLRADFARELWRDLGFFQTPEMFTQSELLVSAGVILISAFTIYVRNHMKAFEFSLLACAGGFLLCLVAVAGLQSGLNKFVFMVLIGLGVYIPYVSIHTTVFERLIAVTREKANIGFMMYVVDAVGYTGYALLLLYRNLWPTPASMLTNFVDLCLVLGVAGSIVSLVSYFYFKIKLRRNEQHAQISFR